LFELSAHVRVEVDDEDEVAIKLLGAAGVGANGVALTWLLGAPWPALLTALTM
jgi:hypothetical protein